MNIGHEGYPDWNVGLSGCCYARGHGCPSCVPTEPTGLLGHDGQVSQIAKQRVMSLTTNTRKVVYANARRESFNDSIKLPRFDQRPSYSQHNMIRHKDELATQIEQFQHKDSSNSGANRL
tara:strand:+ start:1467 stop:1826 length:360 start_codon:yes stop_codon:yes gene_type:complete